VENNWGLLRIWTIPAKAGISNQQELLKITYENKTSKARNCFRAVEEEQGRQTPNLGSNLQIKPKVLKIPNKQKYFGLIKKLNQGAVWLFF